MENFLSEIASKSQSLVGRHNHHSILNIYEEVTEVMAFADHLLSSYAFIYVLMSLSGMFCFSYFFAFLKQGDYYVYIFIISGFIYHLLVLLSVMLSASAVNEAAEKAESNIMFRENWNSHPCRDSKTYLRQNPKRSVEMTLWKIYKVDKSLLISSLGTLLTYGMLLGTLGSVNNQNKITS
ncbi:hypothetical protein AVEN_4330-1 [Araneus ventricosus]|uniref:Uncharacterized protein n=1 Tax=Araneus ventricosus TaxID=182803 RepID=A0A4Y2KXW7_ARAVE|nr:hypothetical protein AVEN_4330-1 [Araneus ventricosus]